MKIEIIVGTDYRDLSEQVNEFLGKIKSEETPKVDVDIPNIAAVVSYDEKTARAFCVDCRFFDDSDRPDGLIALCQMKGKRVRFNCAACEHFKDVRG